MRLVLRQEGDEVVLQIGDTGSGISDQDLPHIFERFYRANTDGWEQGGHAGLGLAITKSILDLHGSPMQVDSTVGVGTTFAFRLPVVQLHAAQTGSFRGGRARRTQNGFVCARKFCFGSATKRAKGLSCAACSVLPERRRLVRGGWSERKGVRA